MALNGSNRSYWRFFWLAGLALALSGRSQASVIFQTGFEPPSYVLGQLMGQNGWLGSTIPVVENSVVFSGSQAVSWDATGTTSATFAHPLTYNSVANPDTVVTFDYEFMNTTTGTASNWGVMSAIGNGGYIGQVFLSPTGNARLNLTGGNFGGVAVTRGTWNDFQLVLDFDTQTISAFVDSQFIASGSFSNASTSLTSIVSGNGTSPGTDTGYWDQLSVVSTPEPGSAGLLAILGIALAPLWRRRSQAE